MKTTFTLFSDYHLWHTHYPQSAAPLAEIVSRARADHADFLIHCGDLCHNPTKDPDLAAAYLDCGVPAYGCIGNHDAEDEDAWEGVLKAYGMPDFYTFIDRPEGVRLILLDTNHYLDEAGVLRHNEPRTHNRTNGSRLGAEQLAWLRRTVEDSPHPCLIFSHASLEMPCGSPDSARFCALVRETNEKRPGHILMCVNGHHHKDHLALSHGAVFFDVNAALNVFWSPRENPLLPEDFRNSARMAKNCCFSRDPLSATVEIETTSDAAHIRITGTESEYLYGASPDALGWNEPNAFGRTASCRISSAEYTIPAVYQ